MKLSDKDWIGKKVKKVSGKPFESNQNANTVKAVAWDTHTQKVVFIFEEDNSAVECCKCSLVV